MVMRDDLGNVATMAVTWAVACAMPIGSHYSSGAGIAGALLAIVVLLVAQQALARVSGVAVGTRYLRGIRRDLEEGGEAA